MRGNMYPVAARAPMKAPAFSGIGGCGMNCRKPLRPKTKKIRPRKTRTAVGAKREIAFMVLVLPCFVSEMEFLARALAARA
jgi:hypothetical protein